MRKHAIRTLVALSTASLAFVAAGPASADQKSGSDSGKASCPIEGGTDGKTYYKPHGSTMNIYLGKDGAGNAQYQHLKCNDGTWEEVAAFTPRTPTFHVSPTGSIALIP